jgi:putative acetyltransferase
MRIQLEPANQPEVVDLIDALDAYQKPLYPPESHHGIDMAALSQPNVVFAVARDDSGKAIACGALVLGPGFGELKRMYVMPELRGQGIAKALLNRLEAEALSRDCRLLALETGISQPEALALYGRAGFERCEPFGDYAEDPFSVFMRKPLVRQSA